MQKQIIFTNLHAIFTNSKQYRKIAPKNLKLKAQQANNNNNNKKASIFAFEFSFAYNGNCITKYCSFYFH